MKLPDKISMTPFWVGGSFLDYCVGQRWMVKEGEGRSTRYRAKTAGVAALKRFGERFASGP